MSEQSTRAETDYSKLSDAELNREIVKRLGWTVVSNKQSGLMFYYPLPPNQAAPARFGYRDEKSAWESIEFRPAQDANAAFNLIENECYNFSHDAPSKTCIVRIARMDEETDYQFIHSVHAKSIPRAICECWLEYQDAKQS